MTPDEARNLKIGDKVMMDGNPDDFGVVERVDETWLEVKWNGDADVSMHRLAVSGYLKRLSLRPQRVRKA
jgi:hypothetical protein